MLAPVDITVPMLLTGCWTTPDFPADECE